MNLGSLVTVAAAAPRNFYHFVCENGTYEANGSHPIPARDRVDFSGLARAAGYPNVHRFDAIAAFERDVAAVLAEPGPVFVDLRLVPGEPAPADYDSLYAASRREAFRQALGLTR